MVDRLCSCCGQSYTNEERHDYEKCYRVCEERVNEARRRLHSAQDNLNMAKTRRDAQRAGRIN